MSGVFLFLVRPDRGSVEAELRSRLDAALVANEMSQVRWIVGKQYAAGVEPGPTGLGTSPFLVQTPRLVVAGNARLDNREEVTSWTQAPERLTTESDLAVIAAAIDGVGESCIPGILGDFSFVVWEPRSRRIMAARDAFGAKTLYYREWPELFAVASRAAVLADGETYDREYLIDYLVGANPAQDRTAFKSVRAVPPGSILARQNGRTRVERFWSAFEFSIDPGPPKPDAIERFRDLLTRAVALRMAGSDDIWSDLSGGLDSSSIVSVAQRLEPLQGNSGGLAGTVTAVDTLGSGDEARYVAAVLDRYPIRNEEARNFWMWQDDGLPPPRVDAPYPSYPFFARDRRMNELIRAAGGRVLLSGEGPDHYLTGSLDFIADWIVSGRITDAARELLRWSTILRTSAWRLAGRYAIAPLLPSWARRRAMNGGIPEWLTITEAEEGELLERLREPSRDGEPARSHYERPIANALDSIAIVLERPIISRSLEMRYPFLYRPLVEFSLRLPPLMRSQPHARKWVQREAMRGILPEQVRIRAGKGGAAGRFAWSLRNERGRIERIVCDGMLDGMDLVNRRKLLVAVDIASAARSDTNSSLIAALTLDTWLYVRSGGWVTETPIQKSSTESEHFRSQPVGNP